MVGVTEVLFVAGAVLWGALSWYVLLGRGTQDWNRTWLVGAGLIAYAVLALVVTDRLDTVVGPIDAARAGAGLGVGVVWLVATHIGYRVLVRLSRTFGAKVRELYERGQNDPVRIVVGPLLLMAVAEELFFRGFVQGAAGLAVGVAVYVVVQLPARNWALALAALLCGALWGALGVLTDGLVAPVIAHAMWTATLTLVWQLPVGAGPQTPRTTGADPSSWRRTAGPGRGRVTRGTATGHAGGTGSRSRRRPTPAWPPR